MPRLSERRLQAHAAGAHAYTADGPVRDRRELAAERGIARVGGARVRVVADGHAVAARARRGVAQVGRAGVAVVAAQGAGAAREERRGVVRGDVAEPAVEATRFERDVAPRDAVEAVADAVEEPDADRRIR